MRRVETIGELAPALAEAMREAGSAFGDARVFLEQAVQRPRHIEVQILADGTGDTVHLFERDCSVQRRHQKVIEIAPAPNLDDAIRRPARHAVAFARSIGYENAGTVEFLLETGRAAGEVVFIEMNPRIQVEHTVTEEVTDVDLVQSQMRIAAGETLADLGLSRTTSSCAARRCSAASRPRTRRRASAPTPGGSRRTGRPAAPASASTAARPRPVPRSARTSTRCSPSSPAAAATSRRRWRGEARARRVPHPRRLDQHPLPAGGARRPGVRRGDLSTLFIDERPELLTSNPSKDRATRLLNWLGDVTVNRRTDEAAVAVAGQQAPAIDLSVEPPAGARERLLRSAGGFARALREQTALAVTETTFRDAHQSLLATRVRTATWCASARTWRA
jgi:pyruvate carboxylase